MPVNTSETRLISDKIMLNHICHYLNEACPLTPEHILQQIEAWNLTFMTEDAVNFGRLINTLTFSLLHIQNKTYFLTRNTNTHTLNTLHSILLPPDENWSAHVSHSWNPYRPGNLGSLHSVLTVDCSTHATTDARNKFVATDRLWSMDTLDEGDETNIYPQNALQSWPAYVLYHITKKYEIQNKFVCGHPEACTRHMLSTAVKTT